jgi:hypothetical protein
MDTRRWFNQGQPQTMQIGVFLLYFNAVFLLVLGSNIDEMVYLGLIKLGLSPSDLIQQLITIFLAVGMAGAAFLIANEKRWGWRLGVVMAALPLAGALILMVLPRMNGVPRYTLADIGLVGMLFDGALFALLVHPQSRDYERIWFK